MHIRVRYTLAGQIYLLRTIAIPRAKQLHIAFMKRESKKYNNLGLMYSFTDTRQFLIVLLLLGECVNLKRYVQQIGIFHLSKRNSSYTLCLDLPR